MDRSGSSICVKIAETASKPMFSSFINCSNSCTSVRRMLSAAEKRSVYFRRLFHFRHMDFEYALWQMWELFVAPQQVYRNFRYRARQQWARDDPAFLVLMVVFLLLSSIGFAFTIGLNFVQSIQFILWVVFVDFIAVSLLESTLFWIVTNRFFVDPLRQNLLNKNRALSDSEATTEVEWGYAFDVHLNGFFPALCILHLLQIPFIPLITRNWFIGKLIGNSLWFASFTYYVYITFLGYRALPFLKRTTVILWPITAAAILYILAFIMDWNFTLFLLHFYRFRLLM